LIAALDMARDRALAVVERIEPEGRCTLAVGRRFAARITAAVAPARNRSSRAQSWAA
jgi:hypothetical protein